MALGGARRGLHHLRQGSARHRPARALRAADAQPHLLRRGRADGRVRPRARGSSRPIDEIPDRIKQAFISAEDKNFYAAPRLRPARHRRRASTTRPPTASRLRGASTITQQVMKNFLLTGDRSGERKIKEIILATRLENTLSKDEILELYLNEIFLGQNSYGVTAAAQIYFGKSLDELTLAEAAYLAALPQAPSVLHPVREKPRAIARRNYVLDQMAENGYVTRERGRGGQGRGPADRPERRDRLRPRPRCRRATTSPTRSAASSRPSSATRSSSPAASPSAPPSIPTCRPSPRGRCATGSRSTTAASRVYRGPVAQIDPASFDPADEASWRARALRHPGAARHRRLAPGGRALASARAPPASASRASPRTPTATSSPSPTRTGRASATPTTAGCAPPRARTTCGTSATSSSSRPSRRDGEQRWSYRQIPAIQGGFMAMDTQTGRVLAMQGGFSYQSSVFNRATQALRQPGSSFKPFVYAAALDSGYSPGDDRARRADRGGDRRRHLGAGELGQHLLRPDADPHRPRAVAQPDDRAHRPGRRHGHRRQVRRALRHLRRHARSSSATRSAPARPRSTRWSPPTPSSPTAASRSSRPSSTGCRTATARPSTATTSAPARAAPPTTSPPPASRWSTPTPSG